MAIQRRLPKFIHITRKQLPKAPAGACMTDKRWSRIWALRRSYALQVVANLRARVPLADVLRTQFPMFLPMPKTPPRLTVELTNFCNLSCEYCPSRLKPRPQGFMTDETLQRILDSIRKGRIARVGLVGLGESTIHPQFGAFVRELGATTRFLSLTTNWQVVTEEVISSVVDAPVRLLNVSVNGGDRESYERSRLGGRFERLLRNLERLREVQRSGGGPYPQINIRLMLRPSEHERRAEYLAFWKPYGAVVSIQLVVDFTGDADDVYSIDVAEGRYPRCKLPFAQMSINWDGEVPLCPYIYHQADDPRKFILGNVNQASLVALWNHPLMTGYRHGHKQRLTNEIPLCNGCGGS